MLQRENDGKESFHCEGNYGKIANVNGHTPNVPGHHTQIPANRVNFNPKSEEKVGKKKGVGAEQHENINVGIILGDK
jgi:hypothetical protein